MISVWITDWMYCRHEGKIGNSTFMHTCIEMPVPPQVGMILALIPRIDDDPLEFVVKSIVWDDINKMLICVCHDDEFSARAYLSPEELEEDYANAINQRIAAGWKHGYPGEVEN